MHPGAHLFLAQWTVRQQDGMFNVEQAAWSYESTSLTMFAANIVLSCSLVYCFEMLSLL